MIDEPKETNWFSSYCTTSIHIMSTGIKKIKSIFNTQPDFNNRDLKMESWNMEVRKPSNALGTEMWKRESRGCRYVKTWKCRSVKPLKHGNEEAWKPEMLKCESVEVQKP